MRSNAFQNPKVIYINADLSVEKKSYSQRSSQKTSVFFFSLGLQICKVHIRVYVPMEVNRAALIKVLSRSCLKVNFDYGYFPYMDSTHTLLKPSWFHFWLITSRMCSGSRQKIYIGPYRIKSDRAYLIALTSAHSQSTKHICEKSSGMDGQCANRIWCVDFDLVSSFGAYRLALISICNHTQVNWMHFYYILYQLVFALF